MVHEIAHRWDWRKGTALSRAFMIQAGASDFFRWDVTAVVDMLGIRPAGTYHRGSATASQSGSPDSPCEDWADSVAAYTYPLLKLGDAALYANFRDTRRGQVISAFMAWLR